MIGKFSFLLLVPVIAIAADTSMNGGGGVVDTTRTVGAIYLLVQALGTVLGLFPSHTWLGRAGRWLATFPGQFLRK